MDEKNKLLEQIRLASFGMNEVNLFLNTHPEDKVALNHYQHYRALRDQAMKVYTSKYGPLTPYGSEDTASWTWIESPWPWQFQE